MANIPRLRADLMHDATMSAWIQPLAVVYWPYITNLRSARASRVVQQSKALHRSVEASLQPRVRPRLCHGWP